MDTAGEHAKAFMGPLTSRLAFWRVRLWLSPRKEISLPEFSGALIRGALGSALRRVSCVTDQATCTGCAQGSVCAYGYSFETPLSVPDRGRLSAPFAPHPFVLVPPPGGGRSARSDRLPVDLVLVGRGRSYLASFIKAFREVGRAGLGPTRVKTDLVELNDLHPGGSGSLLGEGPAPFSPPRDFTVADLPVDLARRVTLTTLSPLRLVAKGGPAQTVELDTLLRALFRRLGALSRFHCGFEPEVDYRGLLERASGVAVTSRDLTWTDLRRYSSRQHRRMALGGVTGSLTFAGELEPFWPFLRLGEWLHVGKGTAFGLGGYRLTIPVE